MFQSPHGDSFLSDQPAPPATTGKPSGFNPLTGIRSFLTPRSRLRRRYTIFRFNPLTGIRSFLTVGLAERAVNDEEFHTFQSPHGDSFLSDGTMRPKWEKVYVEGFNPLTGIRSFLTPSTRHGPRRGSQWFQSPHGDSFLSDQRVEVNRTLQHTMERFNPLTGIRSFLTEQHGVTIGHQKPIRFNPLTGIRSFLTAWHVGLRNDHRYRFNPLTGIRSFLTMSGIRWTARAVATFQSPHGDSFLSDPARP